MNFLLGLVLVIILYAGAGGFNSPSSPASPTAARMMARCNPATRSAA